MDVRSGRGTAEDHAEATCAPCVVPVTICTISVPENPPVHDSCTSAPKHVAPFSDCTRTDSMLPWRPVADGAISTRPVGKTMSGAASALTSTTTTASVWDAPGWCSPKAAEPDGWEPSRTPNGATPTTKSSPRRPSRTGATVWTGGPVTRVLYSSSGGPNVPAPELRCTTTVSPSATRTSKDGVTMVKEVAEAVVWKEREVSGTQNHNTRHSHARARTNANPRSAASFANVSSSCHTNSTAASVVTPTKSTRPSPETSSACKSATLMMGPDVGSATLDDASVKVPSPLLRRNHTYWPYTTKSTRESPSTSHGIYGSARRTAV